MAVSSCSCRLKDLHFYLLAVLEDLEGRLFKEAAQS